MQLPLIEYGHGPAFQHNPPGPSGSAPSSNLLVKIARGSAGKFLGCYSIKYIAGVLIGLGAVLTPAGGLGLGLILAGSMLLAVSTTLSIAALTNKNFSSINQHLAKSLICVCLGVGLGMAATTLVAIGPATDTAVGNFVAAVSIILAGVPPVAFDARQRYEAGRPAVQINGSRIPTPLKNDINAILNTLFASSEKVTVSHQNDEGDVVTTEFIMEERQDKITSNPINGSSNEWIAVEKTPNCYELFEASSFYDEAGQPRFTRHPYTRVPMQPNMIIRGQTLLNLLRQASPEPTELTTIYVAHDDLHDTTDYGQPD